MKRVLAFFGAFNPPTLAHLELAGYALKAAGRESVVFVPSRSVYIRENQGKDFAYPDRQRLAMLRAAAESRPWMRVTDWEITRTYQPRTYETLCHLRDEGMDAALLMGSDKLTELEHGWLHVREIAEQFGMVCLARGGDDCERIIRESAFLRPLAPYILTLETPRETKQISSTRVRKLVTEGRTAEKELAKMVPAEILALLDMREKAESAGNGADERRTANEA